jgi:hypothetical protein
VINFFGPLQHLSLQTFKSVVLKSPTPDHFDRLFSALHRSSSAALREISLYADFSDPRQSMPHPINPDSISLLFPFHNLEVLSIETPTSFKYIDDSLISDIADAWPRLRALRFCDLQEHDEHTKVTVFGLLPLSNCAYLKSLTISLDSTIPDTQTFRKADGTFYNGSLSHLAVGNSPIEDPEAVAAFLSNVFPNLTSIDAWVNVDFGPHLEEESAGQLWKRVWNSYLMLVNIRRQERGFTPRAQGMC